MLTAHPTLRWHRLLKEILPGDTMPRGMVEFENDLARGAGFDAERVEKEHRAAARGRRSNDCDLKKNRILLPKRFMTVGKDFKP